MPTGERSLVLPGIDMSSTQDSVINQAVVRHTYRDDAGQDVTIIGTAAASPSSAISRRNRDRWVTEVYDLNSLSPRTTAKATELAKIRLKRASGYSTTYTFSSVFMPYRIGDVIELRQGKVRCQGIVTNIDMRMDAAGTMTTTIRKVRTI
jgi:hypothetical protein